MREDASALLCVMVAVLGIGIAAVQDETATRATVDRLNEAINRQNVAALSALLTDHTVFENTAPPPGGTRYQGKAAVTAFWQKWFASNSGARFEVEDIIVAGDRCVVRWVYRKTRDGKPWHLRGIDVFTVPRGENCGEAVVRQGLNSSRMRPAERRRHQQYWPTWTAATTS